MKVIRWFPLVAAALVIACTAPSGTPEPSSPSPVVSPSAVPELSSSPAPVVSPSEAPSPAGGSLMVLGTVTAGPVCPVAKWPPDPQCAPRPVAGAVVVATNAAGAEIGRATTAADGSYELTLGESGTVLITGLPVKGLMGLPSPVQVTVSSAGPVERVDLQYDTGIR